ncbi:hypothetical protein ACJJID_13935 [Microbulbifer sp. CnH-101-G]|uniref:hypothetical protein n=1 Tax=Microbulbifer sp. CnH-101-G TaxID=3243393 RepID=UPI00403A38EE
MVHSISRPQNCVVCRKELAKELARDSDGIHQECPRCGEFKVVDAALHSLEDGLREELRTKVSGWVFEQFRAGGIPVITKSNLKQIFTRPIPSVEERAMRLLVEASRNLEHLGAYINLQASRFEVSTYSSKREDVDYLLVVLEEQNLVNCTTSRGDYEITPAGYRKLDELSTPSPASSRGFVAMWFAEELNSVYSDGFEAGILRAGYDSLRIDKAEHINRIDDEIIRQIKASRFVVADFTGHRGGVYFEAGYALGLNLPVIWTCKKDHMQDLHFDIRQFNCIDWESPGELAERLTMRIEAVLGPGPNKSLV